MQAIFISVLLVMVMLVGVGGFFFISPTLGAKLIKKVFDKPVIVTDLEQYESFFKQIELQKERTYPSRYERNTYDCYTSRNVTKKVPLLVWVHGGAYVGGDKRDMTEFATRISATSELVVIAMNYALAPKNKYPSQLEQLDELIQHLIKQPPAFWDQKSILLGGDSAGAQIALQYAVVQTNTRYAQKMPKLTRLIAQRIVGVISYCGPVDLTILRLPTKKSLLMHFFTKTVAWSLIGTKHWQDSQQLFEASIVEHATLDFPPIFVTDGNKYSFSEQGLRLTKRLKVLGVAVSELFFETTQKVIPHEYQFNYATKEAQDCFEQTVRFIKRVTQIK